MSINKFSGKDLLELAAEAASYLAAKVEALRADYDAQLGVLYAEGARAAALGAADLARAEVHGVAAAVQVANLEAG